MNAGVPLYDELILAGASRAVDKFDLHVVCSIIATASMESGLEGRLLSECIGLDQGELTELYSEFLPGAGIPSSGTVAIDQQEQALRDILWMNSAEASVFEQLLSRMIARRSLRPNHLWQDLGLANRDELNRLMKRHFPRLEQRNSQNMKWKKFFYRMMCTSEEFRLCAAPVCSECDDFDDCFGSEDGESLLAQMANGRLSMKEVRQ